MGARPIFITEGDPSGISSQLIAQEEALLQKISQSHPVFLIRSNTNVAYPFSEYKFTLGEGAGSKVLPNSGLYQLDAETYLLSTLNKKYSSLSKIQKSLILRLMNGTQTLDRKITFGKPSISTGRMSYYSLLAGMSLVEKFGGSLITLPLSKEWVIKSGIAKFRGHTEALAEFFHCPSFMLMAGEKWNVIPLTTHIPIRKVSSELKKLAWRNLFQSILDSKLFPKNARIGFMGLNPHAGEGGKVGDEEGKILQPAMNLAKKMGFKVDGPLSADSTFHLRNASEWDILLACYHDQGLIPFKLLEGKKGINLTLGLPFLRVSPDHGPAYNIAANKGKVDSMSLRQCLEWVQK